MDSLAYKHGFCNTNKPLSMVSIVIVMEALGVESVLISNDIEAVTHGCGLFIIVYESALTFPDSALRSGAGRGADNCSLSPEAGYLLMFVC